MTISILRIFLILEIIFLGSPTYATNFTPKGIYAEDVEKEIRGTRSFTKLNLQNKPLLFASRDILFDPEEVSKVLTAILEKQKVEIVDLSLNRLPEDALPNFIPLLEKPEFKYLDITTNSGADTLDGMRCLTEALSSAGKSLPEQVSVLKKIIWVTKADLEAVFKQGLLPSCYAESHGEYYRMRASHATGEKWRLPELSAPPAELPAS